MQIETKATYLGKGLYGCRVFINGELTVEARVHGKHLVGPAFRDLMRTLDKLGGNACAKSARRRKFKAGNISLGVRHIWRQE